MNVTKLEHYSCTNCVDGGPRFSIVPRPGSWGAAIISLFLKLQHAPIIVQEPHIPIIVLVPRNESDHD